MHDAPAPTHKPWHLPGSVRQLTWLARAIVLGTALLLGAFWFEEWRAAQELRQHTLETSSRTAHELADAVARQMEATVQGVDLMLLQLRATYVADSNSAQFDTAARVAIDALANRSIQGIVVTDARGYVVYSSISPKQVGTYLGDRDYIRGQMPGTQAPVDQLLIGTPVRSRLLESWSVPVSRPLLRDGQVAGMIVIGLKPDYFADRLIDPRLSREDVVSVFHPDGSYIARNHLLDKVLGTRAPNEARFLYAADPASLTEQRAVAPADGRMRLYAWQRVPGYPLVANVGLDEQTVLGPIEANMARARLQNGIASVVVMLLALGTGALLHNAAHSQRRLAESETRYRAAFEENASIKLLVDPKDGRIVDANEAAVSFYGYARAQLLDLRLSQLNGMRTEDFDRFFAQARAGQHLHAVLKQRMADGQTRRVEAYTGSIAEDERALLFCVIHDISERHATEQKLKLAASMFAHTHEGIFYCDADGRILDVNDAYTRLTGYKREEVLGHDYHVLEASRHRAEATATIWNALRADGNWRGEFWIRSKSGGIFVVLLDLSAITDDQGQASAYVGVFSDITLLKEQERHLQRMAHFDALTGLPNRVLMTDRLNQALAGAQRQEELIAVAFLDLDGFKPVNDRYGHHTGDEVLIEVARRLDHEVRASDTVCRLGGDEFVLMLRNLVHSEEARAILERVVVTLEQPYEVEAAHIHGITASIGYARFPDDALDAERLLSLADEAMYEAKRAGGNMVRHCPCEPAEAQAEQSAPRADTPAA